jgi:hypothetical protein
MFSESLKIAAQPKMGPLQTLNPHAKSLKLIGAPEGAPFQDVEICDASLDTLLQS